LKAYLRIALSFVLAGSFALTTMHVSAARHNAASTTPPKLKKGVTIHIWDYFPANKSDPERALLANVVKGWQKATGNKVVLDGHPTNANGVWCVKAPAHQAPDIIMAPHDQVGPLVSCKSLTALPAWAFPKSLQKQYTAQAIRAISINGKFYSFPWAAETTGIYYNKQFVPNYPKPLAGNKYVTWKQLITLAQSKPGGAAFGLVLPLNDFYFDYQFFSAGGGYVFKYNSKTRKYDTNNIGLDNAGGIAGLQWMKDLSTNGQYKLMPPSTDGSLSKGLFEQNKSAMFVTGPWIGVDLDGLHMNFGFQPSPSFDGKHLSHPFGGIQVAAVNAFSPNKNEAFSLSQYISLHLEKPELDAKSRVPVLLKLLKSKQVQGDPYFKALDFATSVQMVPMPGISEMGQVWAPMADALTNVVKGNQSPADAAHAAVAKIKSDIAKAHGG
jgi:arabinogalactan oligomer/maltooligosaccharide transport system substrate-binding protein